MESTGGFIPYGRQCITDEDIEEVITVLRSEWLTTGPNIKVFEDHVARYSGAKHGAAVSSGTAGLHAAFFAAGLGEGDEIIVPPLTFAATANAAIYLGAKPVFCDIDPVTLQLDPARVEEKITPRTKAIVAVDYAGLPCDYSALRAISSRHNLVLIADACHSIGATYEGKMVGTLADLSVYSFHPVKHITTGEGGMVVTENEQFAERMRIFRNHGITSDHRQRAATGSLSYEMTMLGYNYRMTDFQAALGVSQLKKLPAWIKRRQQIAAEYDRAFRGLELVEPQGGRPGATNAHHLYVIKLALEKMNISRDQLAKKLRDAGIGVNVHYPPVHLHPFYREKFGYKPGDFAQTEWAYERILSIPMYPSMTDQDVARVSGAICESIG